MRRCPRYAYAWNYSDVIRPNIVTPAMLEVYNVCLLYSFMPYLCCNYIDSQLCSSCDFLAACVYSRLQLCFEKIKYDDDDDDDDVMS